MSVFTNNRPPPYCFRSLDPKIYFRGSVTQFRVWCDVSPLQRGRERMIRSGERSDWLRAVSRGPPAFSVTLSEASSKLLVFWSRWSLRSRSCQSQNGYKRSSPAVSIPVRLLLITRTCEFISTLLYLICLFTLPVVCLFFQLLTQTYSAVKQLIFASVSVSLWFLCRIVLTLSTCR